MGAKGTSIDMMRVSASYVAIAKLAQNISDKAAVIRGANQHLSQLSSASEMDDASKEFLDNYTSEIGSITNTVVVMCEEIRKVANTVVASATDVAKSASARGTAVQSKLQGTKGKLSTSKR